jgi:hypothetical protein
MNAEFEWSSSNPEILRVWNNRFRGLAEGKAEVIARTVDGTVEKRIDSVHGIKIYFSNGDFWETIKYSPSLINTCGKRVNLIYIDRTIPEEDIPSFKACCTAPPYQGYYFF